MFLPVYDQNKIAHIEFPFVNYAILGVTVLVFLLQLAGGEAGLYQSHIVFGMIPAVVGNLVEGPAPWLPEQATLVTYTFLHADWMHLLSNMLFLWVFGDNIEDALGHFRYLVFYLLCAILAALAHMALFPTDIGPLVGASGAVAGVIGAYLILYPRVRIFVLSKIVIYLPLAIPAWMVLGVWILLQFGYALLGGQESVAWWAHIGGFAAGIILVVVMKRREVALFGGR